MQIDSVIGIVLIIIGICCILLGTVFGGCVFVLEMIIHHHFLLNLHDEEDLGEYKKGDGNC